MGINYRTVGRDIQLDARKTKAELREALASGQIKPDEFSLRKLFESVVPHGREAVELYNPNNMGSEGFMEAAGAVDTAQFANITGQIIYTKLLQGYQAEDFVFTKTIPVTPSPFPYERIAGIGEMGDEAGVVGEGKPFPMAGLNEDYIDTPMTLKRGNIIGVTKEAVYFDRTNQVLMRAQKVGTWLGVNKEKRAIDCMIDENTTLARYKWRGTVYKTYAASGDSFQWVNTLTSTALVDWSSINAADQVFNAITDPNTGEPIIIEPNRLIVPKGLEMTGFRIRNATEVRVATPGFATTGNPSQTTMSNPVGGKFDVLTSRLLGARMATATNWYYGRPDMAFTYMENFPITVVEAPPNNSAEFERDIVAQYKASERGAFCTVDPRYMVKVSA